MKPLGKKLWAIPGGHIPPTSTGHEPQSISCDKVYFLNTGDETAEIELTVFYTDKAPVGPYKIIVKAQRLRSVRFNDLIDPEAVVLDIDYACIVVSNVPIIVQFTRQDTSRSKSALCTTMAFPLEEALNDA
jgi:hypothetical protein